jgi:hypothetical protein
MMMNTPAPQVVRLIEPDDNTEPHPLTDQLVEALVMCREGGMSRTEAQAVLIDVWCAPWSEDNPHDQGR